MKNDFQTLHDNGMVHIIHYWDLRDT